MQCLCQFIDLCFERKGLEAIGPHFRWGMSFTEEFQLPLMAYLPDLPHVSLMEPLIEVFFNRTHPLVPVLDRTSFVAEVTRLLELQQAHENGLQAAISSADAPALVTIYSVLALGMDDSEGTVSATATPYLTAAYSLTSHCLSLPYTSSVQGLFMLAIALRARSKCCVLDCEDYFDIFHRQGGTKLASSRSGYPDRSLARLPSTDCLFGVNESPRPKTAF